jgi:hypothetical protein
MSAEIVRVAAVASSSADSIYIPSTCFVADAGNCVQKTGRRVPNSTTVGSAQMVPAQLSEDTVVGYST